MLSGTSTTKDLQTSKFRLMELSLICLRVEILSSGKNLYNKVSHNIMGNLAYFTFKYCTYKEFTSFIDKFYQRTPTFEYTYFELD